MAATPDGSGPRLSEELTEALRTAAVLPRLLVCLDFDGCVAELVADAEAARPVPSNAEAIEALAGQPGVTLAYVSGRPLQTLRRLAQPPSGVLLVGSHGAEVDLSGAGSAAQSAAEALELTAAQRHARAELVEVFESLAAEVEGAWVEHKPAGAGMHVRRVSDADVDDALLARAEAAAGRVEGVHVKAGKRILEAVVVHATKGEAIEQLRMHTSPDAVLFAGDDVTDEQGFAVLGEGDVGVKVGEGPTAASHRIPAPADLAAVLWELVRGRDV